MRGLVERPVSGFMISASLSERIVANAVTVPGWCTIIARLCRIRNFSLTPPSLFRYSSRNAYLLILNIDFSQLSTLARSAWRMGGCHMNSRSMVFTMFLVGSLLLFATLGHAQVGTTEAQLNGTVVDQTGGSVSKAIIALRNADTNRSNTVASNDTGYYIFTNIPPGRYELTVAFTGFSKYTQTGIHLRVGQIRTIDVTLTVAATGQQVIVNTEAPVIEPTRTEVSQVIDTQQINNLPISGRLFTDFALLSPGVATGRISLQSTL